MKGRSIFGIFLIGLLLLVLISLLVRSMTRSGAEGRYPNEIVLHTVSSAKITGLDPADIGDRPTAIVAGEVFECLYQYHYLKRPYEVVPMLAEEMPQVSEDGLTYTIKIKKGIHFADDACFEGGKGRELKAQDFVYSWKRIADIKVLSRNWWILDNRIAGLDEFREYTKSCKSREQVDYSREVEGFKSLDDYTLQIKLKKPWPQIIYILAFQPMSVVAREAVERYGRDIVSHPVGTGAFILDVWHRGSYIEMVRNPNYREDFYPAESEKGDAEEGLLADAGRRVPLADRISWIIVEESQPLWLQFLRGKIDASGIPKDNFGQAIDSSRELTPEMKQRGIHLKTFREPSTFWLGFNMEDKVVGANKALRRAISYAIDREKYIQIFWNNRDEPAYGFIPPLMGSYNPEISQTGQRYDLEKARVYMRDAQKLYGGKLPALKMATGGTGTLNRQIGQFLQRQLKEIEIDLEVDYMDWPMFLEKVKTKSVQMFSLGWIADYPDAESFLQLFYSKNVSPGSNNFNYKNEEFDKIYEQASVMADSPQRTELYRRAEQIVLEDCPAVFMNHPVDYVLHHDWVGNYKPHGFQYGLAKYIRIDMQKRAKYQELLKKVK